MSDLEDLWDDLPVGPAPVESILRRAEREQPGRRLRRSLVRGSLVGAVAGAFVVGVLVAQSGSSGPGDGSGTTALGDQVPAAFHGALTAAPDCDALLQRYISQALPHVGASGWIRPRPDLPFARRDSIRRGPSDGGIRLEKVAGSAPLGSLAGLTQPAAGTVRQTDSVTGTNVQEAGVDEPDVVKTDGSLLVRVDGPTLSTYDVGGAVVRPRGDLDLSTYGVTDATHPQLLLSGTTVVVLDTTATATRVTSVDVRDPDRPAVEQSVTYSAVLDAARQTGTDVRLVLRSPLPRLAFSRGDVDANRQAVRASTLADWLPQRTVDGATAPAVDCGNVAVPRANLGLGTMTVVGFDVSATAQTEGVALAGATEVAYQSDDALYLAATSAPSATTCPPREFCRFEPSTDGRTYLYEFALSGAAATYRAAGEVDGLVPDRWAMDAADGVLRLAVTPSQQTGRFNSVVTLRRHGDQLLQLGRLDGIGRGEELDSVRWFDGLAILGTHRATDPLYSVDLTDPAHPRLLGRLRLPGYTGYLHPLGAHRLVGVGEGPVRGGRGAKVGLFDVTDPAKVRRIAHVDYGAGTTPLAVRDPRQLLWLPQHRTVVTFVRHGNAGLVSTIHAADGQLSEHRMPADYGSDIASLRAVPVAGDRVVLVTGSSVSFLDLGLQ